MRELQGKIAIITGAAGGIGRACVKAFLKAGASVLMTDMADKPPRWVKRPRRLHYIGADLRDPAASQVIVNACVDRFGGVDALVNNAAVIAPMKPAHMTTLDEFALVMDVNVRAAWLLIKHSYPHLKRSRGCVVNISSMSGVNGESGHAIYSASKGALNLLTKAVAIDYGPEGIRANAICPSSVLTPGSDQLFMHLPRAKTIVAYRSNITQLRATARPEQIASVAVFLASPAASFMTGAIVPVSGGSECGYGDKRPPAPGSGY